MTVTTLLRMKMEKYKLRDSRPSNEGPKDRMTEKEDQVMWSPVGRKEGENPWWNLLATWWSVSGGE